MASSEQKIKTAKEVGKMATFDQTTWLKEIAIQLAALNEKLGSVIRRGGD